MITKYKKQLIKVEDGIVSLLKHTPNTANNALETYEWFEVPIAELPENIYYHLILSELICVDQS